MESSKSFQEETLEQTSTNQVGETVIYDAAEERALVRKIDLILMVPIWFMYLFSYADRTNIANAKTAGMATDLHLTSEQYSMILISFFIAYVVFQVPSNLILAKTRPSIYLPTIMALWGMVTCFISMIDSYSAMVGIRFVMGILEAGFAPGVVLMISAWYKRAEQAKRLSAFYSAAVLSGAFGSVVAGAIVGSLDGVRGLAGWRWLFIIEGASTIACALLAFVILPDYPATTRQLSARQKDIAVARLQADYITTKTEDEAPMPILQAVRRSWLDWRTWLLTAGYMSLGGSATMSYFYPTLVAGLGYHGSKAQYMVVPIYAVAFVFVIVSGFLNDIFPKHRPLSVAGLTFMSMIAGIIICAVYGYTARYVLLVFMASGLMSGNALSLGVLTSTFAPMRQEARGVSIATVNGLANLSAIYGAYLFPSSDAPKYLMGFGVTSGLCGVCVVVYVSAYVLIRRWPCKA